VDDVISDLHKHFCPKSSTLTLERVGDVVRVILNYTWPVQKVSDMIFSAKTNEAREVCRGREVEGTFMHIRGFFFQPADSVSRVQPACK